MFIFVLCIALLSFVGLGLPESVLGAVWPIMRGEIGASLEFAGIISFIITVFKTASGLVTDRLDSRFGNGPVTAASMLVMALSAFGCAISRSAAFICVCAAPLGAASGVIDTAVNDYVSRHYKSRHMSWLHCCWGVGSVCSPFVIGIILARGGSWRAGYRFVGIAQVVIFAALCVSLPYWKRSSGAADDEEKVNVIPFMQAFRMKGVPCALLAFFAYCSAEVTASLWGSSYLVEARGINAETAATYTSLVFSGITLGRFLCSFIADRVGDRKISFIGACTAAFGALLMLLPVKAAFPALAGLLIIGLGCAPVVPSLLHATPLTFGKENTSTLVGLEMASAHFGSAIMPPVFGFIAEHVSIRLFPLYVCLMMAVLVASTLKIYRSGKADGNT